MVCWCGRNKPSGLLHVHQLKRSDLTAAQITYGIAPVPDPSVIYQPSVILVGGGPEAVRSLSSTGLTWTIDASAPHADELVEGKIMFLTGRAVGRVLDVRKEGRNLAVTLGPVPITDIIRKCDLQFDPIPIDFREALQYSVPDLPGRVIPARGSAEARPTNDTAPVMRTVAYTTYAGSTFDPQPPADAPQPAPQPAEPDRPDVSSLVDYTVVPVPSADGVGVRGTSHGGGMNVMAEAFIHVPNPTLKPVLRLDSDNNLVEASLTLTGAAGLTTKFEASTDIGLKANVNGRLQASPDLQIPISALVPFAVTVRQMVILKTALNARNAKISALGDYTFGGSFLIGYRNKQWTVGGPIGFKAQESLLHSAQGMSIAASGLDLSHQMKLVFGLGLLGFATGPYFTAQYWSRRIPWLRCRHDPVQRSDDRRQHVRRHRLSHSQADHRRDQLHSWHAPYPIPHRRRRRILGEEAARDHQEDADAARLHHR